MKLKTTLLAATLGLAFAAQAHAVSFDGNNIYGDGLVTGPASLYLTNALDGFDDNGVDFNFSGTAPLPADGALQTAAGVAPGAFDLAGSYAMEGSAYRQNSYFNAGDRLDFDWLFLTNETASGMPDAAYFILGNQVFALAKATGSNLAPDTGLSGFARSVAGNYSHSFASAGNYSFGFAVVDANDFTTSSALNISNFSVTPVPEASTYAMLLAGLGLLGFVARRRKLS